jgi:hypothetical protein
MHRAGLDDLQSRIGMSKSIGNRFRNASMVLFVGVQVWLYGLNNEFVTIIILWQSVAVIYEQLG